MADRRFPVQTEPRGVGTIKSTGPMTTLRDDMQAPLTNSGPSLAIAATAAATTVPERRPSQAFFRRLSMSMSNGRKGSMSYPSNQPRPNTYRMEPENEYRFSPYKFQSKILEVLVEQMKDQTYNSSTVNGLVTDITRNVHQLMKNLQFPRYKFVIQTVITQKNEQDLRITSRCLWDPKTDNMVSVNYESKDMAAVVNVYAVYFE